MGVKEIDLLVKRGLEFMKMGNYVKAEAYFIKAKELTLELQQNRQE